MTVDPPPRITVAIPTCNGARHIVDAVRSVIAQDVPLDLVISDDRSDDDTLDRIVGLAGDRARVSINPERLGLAGNWNRCVELARTPLVAVFHQDDAMHPGHLAAHLGAFEQRVGLVASASVVIDSDGRVQTGAAVDPGGCGPDDRRFPPGGMLPYLATSNPLRCSAVTLRVDAHRSVGGFNRRFRYVVDWDHWIRVAASWETVWVARPTASVRWHPSSETHTFKTGVSDLEETAALLDDLASSHPELGSFRRAADRRLARAYLNRAYEAARSGSAALCRLSMRRAVSLDRATLARIATDPRLAARLALGSVGAGSRVSR